MHTQGEEPEIPMHVQRLLRLIRALGPHSAVVDPAEQIRAVLRRLHDEQALGLVKPPPGRAK